jgi:hypothetical protein
MEENTSTFWKENVSKFEYNKKTHKMLRKLLCWIKNKFLKL